MRRKLKDDLEKIDYELRSAVTHGPGIQPSESDKLEMIILQNLFWSEACFYAINRLADMATGRHHSLDLEEHFNSIANLGDMGKVLITNMYGQFEDLVGEVAK